MDVCPIQSVFLPHTFYFIFKSHYIKIDFMKSEQTKLSFSLLSQPIQNLMNHALHWLLLNPEFPPVFNIIITIHPREQKLIYICRVPMKLHQQVEIKCKSHACCFLHLSKTGTAGHSWLSRYFFGKWHYNLLFYCCNHNSMSHDHILCLIV